MKKFFSLVFCLVMGCALLAQSGKQVKWNFSSKKIADKTYEVHMYAQNVGVDGPLPTAFVFTKNPLLQLDGKVKEMGKLIKKYESTWSGNVNYYEKSVN